MSDNGSGDSPPELRSKQFGFPDSPEEPNTGDQQDSPETQPHVASEEMEPDSLEDQSSQLDPGDGLDVQESSDVESDEPMASIPAAADSLAAPENDASESGERSPDGFSENEAAVEPEPSDQPADLAQVDEHISLPAEEPIPAPADTVEPDAAQADGAELPGEPPANATGSSWVNRLGIGRFLGRGRTSPTDGSPDPSGSGSVDSPGENGAPGGATSGLDSFRGFLDPRLHIPSDVLHLRYTGAASAIALILLMANNAGLALIVASTIVPALIVLTLVQHDVFEKESDHFVAGAVGAGVVAGVIVGWLSSVILRDQWFDAGKLNFGAGGFGGRFAEEAGSAPALVLLICGFVLPAVGIAAVGAVPIVLRRWPQFRNEVMDGLIMAGASAAGLSIGLSIVMWYPMVTGYGPQTQVSDWTLMLIGSLLLRPIVFTLCGAMIGAGVWRYMFKDANSLALVPAIGGIVGVFLLTAGSIQWQSSGVWPEFLWTAAVAVSVFVVYRRVLSQAIATDAQALGDEEERTPCPSCSRLTPAGRFCAYCGASMLGESEEPDEAAKPASKDPAVDPDPSA